MRFFSFMFLSLFFFSLLGDGFWTEVQKDSFHSGRADISGEISSPGLEWKYYLGGNLSQNASFFKNGSVYILSAGKMKKFDMNANQVWISENYNLKRIWGIWDLDGNRSSEIIASNSGKLIVFDEQTGASLSEISFPVSLLKVSDLDNDGFMEILTRDKWLTAGLFAYDFKDGFETPRLKWSHTENIPINGFEITVGSIDGVSDRKDVIIDKTDGGSILFINGATGEEIGFDGDRIFISNSSYGHAELFDLNNNGKNEFIFSGIYADVSDTRTIQLTVYSPDTSSVLWYYEYGRKTTEKRIEMPYNSVGDLDGDGTVEIVANIYNNTKELQIISGNEMLNDLDGIDEENKWVTVIYNAFNGSVKDYVINRYADGIIDLNGDGKKELVLRETQVRTKILRDFNKVSIYSYNDGHLVKLDEIDGAQVMKRPVEMKDKRGMVYTFPVSASGDFDGDSNEEFFVQIDENSDNFPDKTGFVNLVDDKVEISHEIELLDGLNLSFSFFSDNKIGLIGNDGTFRFYDLSLKNVTLKNIIDIGGYRASPLFIKTQNGGRILTANSTLSTFLLDAEGVEYPDEPESEIILKNTMPQTLFSFTSDDYHWFLRMDMTPLTETRLMFYDGNGSLKWSKTLPITSSVPKAFISGNFDSDEKTDLAYMVTYADKGPFIETMSGEDGSLLFQHSTEDTGTYFNRDLLLAGNIDEDKIDDIFAVHPALVETVSGADLSRINMWSYSQWGLNSIAADFDGDGKKDIYLNDGYSPIEVFNSNSDEIWRCLFDERSSYKDFQSNFPGISKIDLDNGFDLVLGGKFGDISAYSGADGTVLWRRCLSSGESTDISISVIPTEELCGGTPLTHIITGDVDGDGREEFVTGDRDGYLYLISAEDGTLIWNMKFDAAIGNPILADSDGDGKVEIIVGVGDGYLYCIDNLKVIATPGFVNDVAVTEDDIIPTDTVDVDEVLQARSYGAVWEAVKEAVSYDVRLKNDADEVLTQRSVIGANQVVIDDFTFYRGDFLFLEVRSVDLGGFKSDWIASDGVAYVEEFTDDSDILDDGDMTDDSDDILDDGYELDEVADHDDIEEFSDTGSDDDVEIEVKDKSSGCGCSFI